MQIDIAAYSPSARAQQIVIGKRFSSRNVLDQANQSIAAYILHGAKLVAYGFNETDGDRLSAARDLLIQADVGRDIARGGKRIKTQASNDAMIPAQTARLRAHAILEAVEQELQEQGIVESERAVSIVLHQTSAAENSSEGLASQLDLLARSFQYPDVVALAVDRGGPEAVLELQEAATTLRQSQRDAAKRPGTAEETQYLNQIDGIIVRLVRRARKAAIAAGRALHDPALALAFKLDQLYRIRTSKSGPPEPSTD